MQTVPENTIAGLQTYFFDSVFDAHKREYPAVMSAESFEERLDAYREGMNDGGCKFTAPAARTIAAMYKEYRAELERVA